MGVSTLQDRVVQLIIKLSGLQVLSENNRVRSTLQLKRINSKRSNKNFSASSTSSEIFMHNCSVLLTPAYRSRKNNTHALPSLPEAHSAAQSVMKRRSKSTWRHHNLSS